MTIDYQIQKSQEYNIRISIFAAELEQVREIKEELAHVALDSQFIFDGSSEETVTYELPDGQRIKVGNERFEAMEILFQPSLIGESLEDSVP